MLWGIVTRINIDNAELLWEEFEQAIQTFFANKVNLGSPAKKDKKTKLHLIPYYRFTKIIICKDDEFFGMQIPNELITDDIRRAPYYKGYMEMVAKHERKIVAEKKGGKKKTAPKANKPVKPAPAKQAKPATTKQPKPKHLVDEPDEEQDQPGRVPEPQGTALHTPKKRSTTDQFIFQRQTPATEEASTGPSAQPQDDTYANIVRETPSPADAETCANTNKVISKGDTKILNIGEEQGKDVYNKVYLAEQTTELNEGQPRSNPGKTLESRPLPNDDKMDEDQASLDPGKSHVALTGSNPEPMHDDFVATVYPKFSTQVILEDPLSSSETLSSMKILDDTYIFRDQFFIDKSTKDELGKQNVDAEVVSMVTVLIHQASTSIPLLSTPIINLSPPKSVASPLLEPFIVETTETTTTTLPLSPTPQQQSITDSKLDAHVIHLKRNSLILRRKSRLFITRLRILDPGFLLWSFRIYLTKSIKLLMKLSKSSSKQQSAPHSEQPIEDVPVPDNVNISDLEDTDAARLSKIKTRPNWLNHVSEEDIPEIPEPGWIIPLTDFADAENN
nr:hypothetical protein [Tanacetum cinerariifolium]